ncbi:MAG: tetratricopeptide repeat protein [Clostridia bacterium]|nr:tetratricopeptide repeat protein [Clostridia bacterium]
MSKTPLNKGTVITLDCKNTIINTEYKETFTILDVRGKGGSSFVYKVRDRSGKIYILKEFFPSYIENDNDALSREGTEIIVKDKYKDEFEKLLNKFESTYNLINNYLKSNIDAGLQNVSFVSICKGNNTCYTQMTYESGESYDRIADENVNFVFRIALAAAKAVKQFHNAGYLLMDIKPANILILRNGDEYVTDIIKLFDFDSVLDLFDIESRNRNLELTPGFAPPEAVNNASCSKKYEINETSDIYEIGAMVRNKLSGKNPVSADARHFSAGKITFSENFAGSVSPSVMKLISNFLFRTMNINQEVRFQNIEEVIKALRELVEKTRPGRIYLRDKTKNISLKFVGREKETDEIEQILSAKKAVFLKSIGGMGKTELALKFAQKYKEKYGIIQFVPFNTSLRNTLTSLDFVNFRDDKHASAEEMLKARLDLLENSDEDILIIIDGFSEPDDNLLDELIMNRNNKVRYIFTTRCDISRFPDNVYDVRPLSDDECFRLFFKYCKNGQENTDFCRYVRKLIATVGKNTLVIKLLADTVKNSVGQCDISQICRSMETSRIDEIKATVHHYYQDGNETDSKTADVLTHLLKIFNLSQLSLSQFKIINNLSLIPETGIKRTDFIVNSRFGFECTNEIEGLCQRGWIDYDEVSERYSIHPVIADLAAIVYSKNDSVFTEYDEYINLLLKISEYISAEENDSIEILNRKIALAQVFIRRSRVFVQEKQLLPAYVNLGRLYYLMCDYNGADETLKKAASLLDDNDYAQEETVIEVCTLLCKTCIAAEKCDCALDYIENAIAVAENYNQKHPDRKISMSALYLYKGEVFDSNGRYDDAIEIYKQIIENCEINANSSEIVSVARFHLGNSLSDKGEPEEAKKYFDEELLYVRKKYGEGSASEAVTLSEIAENQSAIGDYSNAIENYNKAYEILTKKFGPDHPKTKNVRYAVAGVLSFVENPINAVESAKNRVDFATKQYGRDSVQTAYAYKVISELSLQAGNVRNAFDYINKSVEIYGRNLNADNPEYATALMNKAECLYTLGQIDDAKNILFAIRDIKLHSRLDRAIFLANFISLLTLMGNLSAADEYCNEYIDIASSLACRNQHLINAYTLAGNIRIRDGRNTEALEMYKKCEKITDEMFFRDSHNPNKGICLSNIGAAYLNLGMISAADRNLSESLRILESYYPDGHQRLINVYINSGKCRYMLGKPADALDYYKKAKEMMEKLGITSGTVMLSANISLAYGRLGDYEKCYAECNEAIRKAESFGEHINPQIALIYGNYGVFKAGNGKTSEAVENIEKAIRYLETAGKTLYVETAVQYLNLGMVHFIKGNRSEMTECMEKAVAIMKENSAENDIRRIDFMRMLSLAYVFDMQYQKAKEILIEAFTLCAEKCTDVPEEDKKIRYALLFAELGKTAAYEGNTEDAVSLCTNAISICRESKHMPGDYRADCYISMGEVCILAGRKEDAEKYFEIAADICTGGKNHVKEGIINNRRGFIALLDNDTEEALKCFESAENIFSASTNSISEMMIYLFGTAIALHLGGNEIAALNKIEEADGLFQNLYNDMIEENYTNSLFFG